MLDNMPNSYYIDDNGVWSQWSPEKWERLYSEFGRVVEQDTFVRHLISELRRDTIPGRQRYNAAGLLNTIFHREGIL